MVELLIRALQRATPREGWAPFLLALTAILCLPAAIAVARAGEGVMGLVLTSLLAVAVALRLARSRIEARPAALVAGLLGLAVTGAIVGRLLPPLGLLWNEAGYALGWLGGLVRGSAGQPLPFAQLAGYLAQQAALLGNRLWWWGHDALDGVAGPASDPIVSELLVGGIVWAASFLATWQIFRRRAPLAGLLPAGTVVAVVAFFQGKMALFYLFTLVFCSLWLAAMGRLWRHQARWEESHTDYPDDLGLEMTFSLAPWLVGLLLLAAVFPVVPIHSLREAFWRRMDAPWSRLEGLAEGYLGPLDTGMPLGPARGSGGGTLPQAHLLGAGPELSQTVVFYVRTNDPPPPRTEGQEAPPAPNLRRYWRGATYDTYTGQGWINGPLEARDYRANQILDPDLPAGQDLVQQFEVVTPGQGWIYAANAPYRLDQAVRAWWYAPGDLAQLTGSATRYAAVSRPPRVSVATLRSSPPLDSSLPLGNSPGVSTTLPTDLAGRYLVLPDTMPRRVLDLAWQVVGDADNRYDRARRLEAYLRTYPYSLDLPRPPKDRDLVDYFLFDLQEGYCDYYASALVVMARAVGLPARLATGYAQGTYDYDQARWVVTKENGHSWVEIYFQDVGWVEFEPTAGQPALERAEGEMAAPLTVPPRPPRPLRWWQGVPWILVGLAGAAVLLAGLLAWLWWPRPEPAPAAAVRDRYARLVRWGGRLRHPLRDGQTAGEYGRSLGRALGARGSRSRLPQVRASAARAPAEAEHLAEVLGQVQYGAAPLPADQGHRVQALWQRLRKRLWWLWLGGRG